MTFRSRVISGYSRELGYIYIPVHELLNFDMENLETGRGKRLAPPVSVKDRSLPGPVIEFELY